MLRLAIIVAILGLASFVISARRVHLSDYKMNMYREPTIPEEVGTSEVTLEYIEQRLDNFDPTNDATWQMRYYQNNEFFLRGGPIFVYVGGEWEISPGSLRGGHMFDMARTLGGQMFYTEHRFYGYSRPTPDAALENLRFLNIEQALADLAHFIRFIKSTHVEYFGSRVILVGGSYAATMVAWFRQKYPTLASGAWASSAPVLAQVDFIEYKEVVGASIRHVGGEQCYQRLERAISQAEQLIADRNFAEFSSQFRTCEEISDEDPYDIMGMFGLFGDLLAGVVQYHRTGDIESVCEYLLDPTIPGESDLEAYVRWYIVQLFGSNPNPDDCIDARFESDVAFYRNSSWDSYATRSSGRQWFYQTCAEYGWYQTSGSSFQPFGSLFPVDLYIRWCNEVYGDVFNAETIQMNVERKNVMYGALNPNVNNVYFTHGLIDPWRTMGIQDDLNDRSPADIIPDASHCQDLGSATPNDSPRMQEVRNRIYYLTRLWAGLVTPA